MRLELRELSGRPILALACDPHGRTLRIRAERLVPVASEERLSFGSGGEVEAFVAGPHGAGAPSRGWTAEGPVPANLARLLQGKVSASYGAQTSGPHPAIPANLAGAFAAACPAALAPASGPAGACFVQDGAPLPAQRWQAVGTEPFWGARVEGRCITYSHPEDQRGTRVWTRFAPAAGGGTWTGGLNGQPFRLRMWPSAGCSDGMSDTVYPVAAELSVDRTRLTGCVKPM